MPSTDLLLAERLPTLQGATTVCPASFLQKVSKETNTPVDNLSKLTVRQSAYQLYNAILAYAALSPTPTGERPIPLLVRQCIESRDEQDEDEEGGSRSNRFIRALARIGVPIPSQRGLAVPPPPVPNYEMGTTECAVVWPPPEKLTAERLIENQHLNQCHETTDSSTNAVDGRPETNSEPGRQSSTFVIHLTHYSVGEPRATSFSFEMFHEILLVSADGLPMLRRFSKEVIEWFSQQQAVPRLGGKFPLRRFKLDSCGNGKWQMEGMKRARAPESVILPGRQLEAILNDVETS